MDITTDTTDNAPRTFAELLRHRAQSIPDQAAFQAPGRKDLSYAALFAQTKALLGALRAQGIRLGDNVLILMPNSAEALVAIFGTASGATAIPYNVEAEPDDLRHMLEFTRPKAVIMLSDGPPLARRLARDLGIPVLEALPQAEAGAGSFALAGVPPEAAEIPVDFAGPDDPSLMLHTSGTTARPKLIAYTQQSFLNRAAGIVSGAPMLRHPNAKILCVTPVFFSFTLTQATMALLEGGSIAVLPYFEPDDFFRRLDELQPTALFLPPAMLMQLIPAAARHADILKRQKLKLIGTSSAELRDSVWADLERIFRTPVIQAYAMSEVGNIAWTIPTLASFHREGSAGQVVDAARVRIAAEDGTPLPPGQIGEILYKSDDFTGYWNNPEANAQAFHGEWFRTGDEGYLDRDNYIYITGRLKEVINRGGAKVSPLEVEGVLLEHPAVCDAAVFGLPHPELGESVAAAVVGDVTERELRKFAADRLPAYKVPTTIVNVREIPRLAVGKVPRNRLAKLLGLL